MILATATAEIRAYLGGAPGTQPDFYTSWADHNTVTHAFIPDSTSGALNSATPVTIIDSPAAGYQRQAKHISIYNRDAAAITVTVEHYNGTTQRSIITTILDPGWSLQWEPGGTWHVYGADGVLQGGGSSQSQRAESGGGSHGALNGAASVELVPAPSVGFVRLVDSIRIANIDTGVVTIRVRKTIAGPTHREFDSAVALAVDAEFDPVDGTHVVRLAVGESITALMAGAPTTVNPTWVASWVDIPEPV